MDLGWMHICALVIETLEVPISEYICLLVTAAGIGSRKAI